MSLQPLQLHVSVIWLTGDEKNREGVSFKLKGQMEANCVERHAPWIPSFSLSTLLALSLGISLTNGCWLFVYVQFASRLAPFLLFKEVIYNSIHVYAPHSWRNTIVGHRPVFTPILTQNIS